MTTLFISIERGDNSMATSFLVWGAYRRVPQNDGDGTFIGEIPIEASESSVVYEWTTPNGSTNWNFIAIPKHMEQVGIPGRLESA